VLVLRAGGARVSIAPAHGCLIQEIDHGEGNLLWTDGRRPRVLEQSGTVDEESAREFDEEVLIGGWFPMFPSAGVPTATTQQHGWAPRVAWAVVERSATRAVCVATGPFLDGGVAEVTRTIELEPDALTVSSTVRNAGTGVRSFTWGEHPCFSRDLFAGGSAWFAGEQVATVPGHANRAAGHFARSIAGGTAAVLGRRIAIALSDEVGTLSHWLYWYNYEARELPRADTLAWEPSTAAGLGVGDAITADAVERLGAGQTFRASLRCEWTLSTIADWRVG
jgi:hypothetical protein